MKGSATANELQFSVTFAWGGARMGGGPAGESRKSEGAERESGGSEPRLACDSGFESISCGGDLLGEVSRDIWSGEVGEVLGVAGQKSEVES